MHSNTKLHTTCPKLPYPTLVLANQAFFRPAWDFTHFIFLSLPLPLPPPLQSPLSVYHLSYHLLYHPHYHPPPPSPLSSIYFSYPLTSSSMDERIPTLVRESTGLPGFSSCIHLACRGWAKAQYPEHTEPQRNKAKGLINCAPIDSFYFIFSKRPLLFHTFCNTTQCNAKRPHKLAFSA